MEWVDKNWKQVQKEYPEYKTLITQDVIYRDSKLYAKDLVYAYNKGLVKLKEFGVE